MTILPHEDYFDRWMRAKADARFLIEKLRHGFASEGIFLPSTWGKGLENGFTQALREVGEESHNMRSKK